MNRQHTDSGPQKGVYLNAPVMQPSDNRMRKCGICTWQSGSKNDIKWEINMKSRNGLTSGWSEGETANSHRLKINQMYQETREGEMFLSRF